MDEDAKEIEARLLRDPGFQQEWLRQDSLIYGGLIAGCVALLQPFLTSTTLDLPATIAVVSFAIAIPLLAALLMLNQQEAFRRRPAGMRVISVTKAVGQGAAVLGVAAAFWHITWIAGVGIAVSALVAVLIHGVGYSRVEGFDGTANT